jgi:predicted anti-sigma-YlaC factor YlaD
MTTSECPPAEELAALLEGRSRREDRRRILAHLNRCEACFQVFTAATEFRAKFPEYARRDEDPESG